MEKLKMQSPNMVDENIEKIGKLFPDCLTEVKNKNGQTEHAIDFDKLRQELSKEIVEGPEERYQFTWPDKKQAILTANAPINKTLRPCREESVDFDNTQNLYIEGDNLDALKLMREDYLGKVKMIYIDPPYNTGNDFVYKDDFAQHADDYIKNSGQFDDEGNRLVANTESNGRFHTDWLNMIYPRLKVAKDLLSEDGVIFISIDDNEVHNLRKVCDEIFGNSNFIAQIIWERAYSPINLKKHFSESHDYIICYAKNLDISICNGLPRTLDANDRYSNPDNDPRGDWKSSDLSVGPIIESKIYEITTPSGRRVLPPNGYCWRLDKNKFNQYVKDNRIWFGENGNNVPSIKRFLSEVKQGITPMTIWKYSEVGHSQDAAQKLKKLFDGKALFDYPKPVELIKRCITLYSDKNSIILDFFSGSATTAHAVMQLNAEDGGNRKFVMVQLPEITYDGKKEKYKDKDGNEKEKYIIDENTGYPIIEKDSEARKAGYWTISDIGKERIRRAGKKILEEQKEKSNNLFAEEGKKLDTGFRVLKLDSSNMEDVYYTPKEFSEKTLFSDNIKADRTPEDLLFQVLPECNLPLSCKIEEKEIARKKVFIVNDDYLIACFDKDIDETVITEIAKMKPYYFVMRDSSMETDNVADNFDQIFNLYSKETIRKIL
ncbi:MAG: site-specific DNA-methyltransferase [Bacteroidales bacterium]|jgi:adenine-specific DNA-methyltransferase|nr:site-specific DNA-methyltransferase [Bacteroidales bacterium]MCI2146069.1 site-specific DNA-methyltransferase [Bacteroidales bacterium]